MAQRVSFAIYMVIAAIAIAGPARAEDLSGAAYSTCQMFALDRLPANAEPRFPALGERGTRSRIPPGWRANHYEVMSFVENRTTVGERVQNRLYCILQAVGSNHWALDRIIIGNDDQVYGQAIEPTRGRADERRQKALIDWVAAGFERDERLATRPKTP